MLLGFESGKMNRVGREKPPKVFSPVFGEKPGKTGKNREKLEKTGKNRKKLGKTGKNWEKPGKTGKNPKSH